MRHTSPLRDLPVLSGFGRHPVAERPLPEHCRICTECEPEGDDCRGLRFSITIKNGLTDLAQGTVIGGDASRD